MRPLTQKQLPDQQYFQMVLTHEYEYTRNLGSYRPQFQGKPQGYYELTSCEICSSFSICTTIVVFFFFLCYGFFMWTSRVSTSNFVLVWSIVLCVFVPLFMILAYLGSRNKVEIEQKLIKDALEKQLKLKPKAKGIELPERSSALHQESTIQHLLKEEAA